jgi:hypothetical protein
MNEQTENTHPKYNALKGVGTSDLLADMELVHRQLHCVKHLCAVVTELAEAKIMMLPKSATMGEMGHHLIKMDGSWTNWFMQEVGEMLNNMDAVDPEKDKRWDSTFGQAHARWKNLTAELNAKSANVQGQTPPTPNPTTGA